MSRNAGVEAESGPPQSWLLNDINRIQGEMEILRGDPACVFMPACDCAHTFKYHSWSSNNLPFLLKLLAAVESKKMWATCITDEPSVKSFSKSNSPRDEIPLSPRLVPFSVAIIGHRSDSELFIFVAAVTS